MTSGSEAMNLTGYGTIDDPRIWNIIYNLRFAIVSLRGGVNSPLQIKERAKSFHEQIADGSHTIDMLNRTYFYEDKNNPFSKRFEYVFDNQLDHNYI